MLRAGASADGMKSGMCECWRVKFGARTLGRYAATVCVLGLGIGKQATSRQSLVRSFSDILQEGTCPPPKLPRKLAPGCLSEFLDPETLRKLVIDPSKRIAFLRLAVQALHDLGGRVGFSEASPD